MISFFYYLYCNLTILSAGVCTPHSCDLELKDIGKISFIKEHLEEKRHAIRFIRAGPRAPLLALPLA